MRDEIIVLIWPIDEVNEEKTQIFTDVKSVGQTEFFSASQKGYKAELQFEVWKNEYEGQPFVEFKEKRYTIYRTYEVNQNVELYAGSKIGV